MTPTATTKGQTQRLAQGSQRAEVREDPEAWLGMLAPGSFTTCAILAYAVPSDKRTKGRIALRYETNFHGKTRSHGRIAALERQ